MTYIHRENTKRHRGRKASRRRQRASNRPQESSQLCGHRAPVHEASGHVAGFLLSLSTMLTYMDALRLHMYLLLMLSWVPSLSLLPLLFPFLSLSPPSHSISFLGGLWGSHSVQQIPTRARVFGPRRVRAAWRTKCLHQSLQVH